MTPIVRTLILKRYRSVVTAKLAFENPTFLIGRNGAGKSNLVDALTFLAECTSSPLSGVFERRGGIEAVRNKTSGQSFPPNLGLGVVLGALDNAITKARYAFEVRALPDHGFEVVREQCCVWHKDGASEWFDRSKKSGLRWSLKSPAPSIDAAALALPLVGSETRFAPVVRTLAGMRAYAIEPGKLRELQDPDSGLSLKPEGQNAASVLKEIQRARPDDVRRISSMLAAIVPNTIQVRPIKHGKKVSVEFVQRWDSKQLRLEAFSMSDGTLRALGLILAVYQHPAPTVIAIEEPEATIHPGALGAVLDLIHEGSARSQVIITTHSPDVLDAKWIEPRHIRVVEWGSGATRVGTISTAARSALDEHLSGAGELLRSNVLDVDPLFEDLPGPQGDLFEPLP